MAGKIDMILLSVIVPAYNNENDISIILEAFSKQTLDADQVEYIIVNNNSKDNTKGVVNEYAKNLPITVRCVDENNIQSSYAARNAGIRAAKGNILLFTDSDCVPEPEWAARMLDAFDRPEIGIVGGAIQASHGDSLVERFSSEANVLSQEHSLKNPYLPFFQTANVAYRREAFQKAGLFRSRLKTGGDADMCWRVQKSTDFELRYCAEAKVLHRHRTTLAGLNEQFSRYGRSSVYLNRLYGTEIQPEPRTQYFIRKGVSWAFLHLPITLAKRLAGQATNIDLFREPLRLYIRWCRKTGISSAETAGLPKELDIEYLG
ncbi:glycosyltransferase [Rhizobium phaseoli]|uniref:glycosyltransferase n=1 Tax=Rhizobium phaseoli TaxID=396 RepID=UPI001FDF21EA|nr:glycosyltransferase [Rhizobium phaseoli]